MAYQYRLASASLLVMVTARFSTRSFTKLVVTSLSAMWHLGTSMVTVLRMPLRQVKAESGYLPEREVAYSTQVSSLRWRVFKVRRSQPPTLMETDILILLLAN